MPPLADNNEAPEGEDLGPSVGAHPLTIKRNGTVNGFSRPCQKHDEEHVEAQTLLPLLPDLLEPVYEKYRHKTAVICGDAVLTYGELSSLVSRLSASLAGRHGIERGDLVGVALERSVELVAVMLAVHRAGAAYMPIVPDMPAARLAQMLETAQPKIIITDFRKPAAFLDPTLEAVACLSVEAALSVTSNGAKRKGAAGQTIEGDKSAQTNRDGERRAPCDTPRLQDSDLAYVMYTSGSTGRPKGCEVTHGGLANLVSSMRTTPGCNDTDTLLAITTVSFDMAVFDWFMPLCCGGTIVIAEARHLKDMSALTDLAVRHRVTMMQGTPSIWGMLLESGWGDHDEGGGSQRGRRLSKVICAGEPLPKALAERLLDRVADEVWNCYGATECSVYSSAWRVERNGKSMLCGGAIANTALYILDEESRRPVADGEVGELWIGGAGVGRGYRGDAALSSERFLPDPFSAPNPHPGSRGGGTMYRTGDVGRLLEGGTMLELLGRADNQVKIRGHRIETGDVEAAITAHPDVSAAVVVGRGDWLVAYCKKGKNETPEQSQANAAMPDVDHGPGSFLRPWLAERLPAYMVPAFFVETDAFPLSPSGKIDRQALPDPIETLHDDTASERTLQQTPPFELSAEVAIPATMPAASSDATELGAQILLIWRRVLGHNRIRLDDNFFEVGGNSLRLVRVQKELEELLGRRVPAPKLFEHFTIRALAGYLAGRPGNLEPDTLGRADLRPSCVHDFQGSNGQHQNDDLDDIAIISVACRLPGGVSSPKAFWELLEAGGDAITDVPADRWAHVKDDFHASSYPRRGGFLSSDINAYDAAFFGISPREARRLDPAHYLLLETSWEVFERAGLTRHDLRGSQTGVFVGSTSIPAHAALNPAVHTVHTLADVDGYTTTGSAGAAMSGRVAYHLGLQGPVMTADAACASSLVATHLACNALRSGECDLAVAAGVHLMLNSALHAEFARLGGMSSDGRCRAFSADADGTGWSEGCVVVLLKRLSDAVRDGDDIRGVVKGSAVNHGGRAASLTTPSASAQAALLRSALRSAHLGAGDIDYVEAHGTATKLGDPIEAAALAEVFGPSRVAATAQKLLIGAAKSNIGHLQAASGLVGLLKVVLSMEHGVLPRTLHITEPTPAVDWAGSHMAPVLSNQPWLAAKNGAAGARLRRAGVSSFGIGGTNAHVIVEESPPRPVKQAWLDRAGIVGQGSRLRRAFPFLISGDTDAALRDQAAKLHQHLSSSRNASSGDREQESLADVAFSLATSRSHFRKRAVLHASSRDEALSQLASIADPDADLLAAASPQALPLDDDYEGGEGETPKLAMLFAGQGTQWAGMGRALSESFPIFDATIHDIAARLDGEIQIQASSVQQPRPLLEVMWAAPGSEGAALLQRTAYTQPALFALEVSLFTLWRSWGVAPEVLLGHSVGELSAAHVAGVIPDLDDACRLAVARGRLMQGCSDEGHCMVSLEASPAEVDAELATEEGVEVAAYNSPMQTVISGSTDAVNKVRARFAVQGRKTKVVVAGHAFHSRHIDGMLDEFRAVADTVQFATAKIPIVSTSGPGRTGRDLQSRDGGAICDEMRTARYWVRQVREAVCFSNGIHTLARGPHRANVFVELGPDSVLCGMGAACLADPGADGEDRQQQLTTGRAAVWLPSLGGSLKDGVEVLQRSLGSLHVRHAAVVDWREFFRGVGCRRVQLPTYAFQRDFHVYGAPDQHLLPDSHAFHDLGPGRGSPLKKMPNGVTRTTNGFPAKDTNDRSSNQFEVAWHLAPKAAAPKLKRSSNWGLILPSGPSDWATSVTVNLSKAGVRLVPLSGVADATGLDGLVCIWHDNADTEATSSPLAQDKTQSVMKEALSQLQDAAEMQFKTPLVWVTRHAVGTGEDTDRDLRPGAASLLWGLMRTARSEHPELRLRLIDAGAGAETNTIGADIFQAVLLLDTEPECAVRAGGRVLVPRLQSVSPTNSSSSSPILPALVRTDGAVLITGGLGDLGSRVARWLVEKHGVRDLVLTSRQGRSSPGADALMAELTALGARVEVVAADVSDPPSVRSLMAVFANATSAGNGSRNGRPLRGVVHAAGVLDSGVLSTMTPSRCETTLAPKARAAWDLHESLHDLDFEKDLDMFVMFSSISGVLGMPGLANYAASNTFLDALAHLRKAQGLPGTSVAYGHWAGGGGMGARLGAAANAHLARFGLDPLDPDEGPRLLEQAVISGRALTMAAVLDPVRLRGYIEEQQGGGIPVFFSLLLPAPNLLSGNSDKTEPVKHFPPASNQRKSLREALAEANPAHHAEIVLGTVQNVVARTLGHTHASAVEVDRPLRDVGIDSLTAVQMRNQLSTLTGLSLSVNVVFMHPNLRALSRALLLQLQEAAATGSKDTTSTSPTTAARDNGLLDLAAMQNGVLDKRFTFTPSGKPNHRPKAVFLTGATGFVGAFILAELLSRGVRSHCLVRARSPDEARSRLVDALESYSLWQPDFASLLHPVVGDAALPLLGISDQTFHALSETVEAVCHAAGLVDWLRPLEDYVGPNIVSAHEILRLASVSSARGCGDVHLVSTISTLPLHLGLGLTENEDVEYGYGTSKYAAERLVAAARWRGCRAAVYRLPFVTASSLTGHFRRDKGDFLHNLIAGSFELGAFPLVEGADMAAVLPVDYLARTIVSIMLKDENKGNITSHGCPEDSDVGDGVRGKADFGWDWDRDFDFLSTHAPTCEQFVGMAAAAVAGEQPGGDVESKQTMMLLPFGEWKRKAADHAAASPDSPLARIAAILDGLTDDNVAGMFRGLPVGRHVLGSENSRFPAPALDEGFVQGYMHQIRR